MEASEEEADASKSGSGQRNDSAHLSSSSLGGGGGNKLSELSARVCSACLRANSKGSSWYRSHKRKPFPHDVAICKACYQFFYLDYTRRGREGKILRIHSQERYDKLRMLLQESDAAPGLFSIQN